jgi:hypothetical protein
MLRYLVFFAVFLISPLAIASCINEPVQHFVFKGDNAEDRKAGLVWKRCAVGMTWNKDKKTCLGEPEALHLDAAKIAATTAGSGWRVPTGKELETLLVRMCNGQKIDTAAFPATEASDYGEGANFWTSTEAMPGMYYYFDFTNGWVDMHSAGYGLSVLLVKDSGLKKSSLPNHN